MSSSIDDRIKSEGRRAFLDQDRLQFASEEAILLWWDGWREAYSETIRTMRNHMAGPADRWRERQKQYDVLEQYLTRTKSDVWDAIERSRTALV